MIRRLLAALALAALPTTAHAQARDPAMDAAVRDMCHRQVAMLGEGSHGDGATFAFKAALIRRLVDECGYNAVFFEASHYDFLEFQRRLRAREPVTPRMVGDSIGGLWSRYAELAPLIQFLFERAQAGRITLGGLDDQLSSATGYFSLDQMPERLTSSLAAPRRAECREIMRRRSYWDYPEGTHYDAPERARIQACVAEMTSAISRRRASIDRTEQLQMLANIDRTVARNFLADPEISRRRDESMFLNLRWLSARIGPRAKVIIWAHNAHVAYDASASHSFPAGGSLGAWVTRAYGRRAFALGFSAYGGVWRSLFVRGDQAIAPAPEGSLEALAMAGIAQDKAYRDRAWLARLGRVPGRPFFYEAAPADWARVFDGIVVFRAERAPLRNP